MASPINNILGLKHLPKEYQGLNECSRIVELKGRKIGAAFPSAFGNCNSLSQAPFRQTVTVILNDAADCSSFTLCSGGHFDESCESENDSDDDGILRSFEEELFLSSNDLAVACRLRFVLYHEDRRVATYRALLYGKKLCLMVPSNEDSSGSALASLFDYASEQLGCDAVILCVPRSSGETASVIRSYMFIGFENLPRIHELCDGLNGTLFFFMAYHM